MNTSNTAPAFEALLDYIKQNRGFDFTGYKRSSLIRRVDKRMHLVGVEGYAEYLDYLQVHPDEFAHVFNMILINVTEFFRDTPAWEMLRTEILPKILESCEGKPIRIWSAGCASGEEPYSLAMLMAEAIGLDGVRDRVKIYATDVDEEALSHARQAIYTEREMAGVPEELRNKYFDPIDKRFIFHKDLRRAVIFGRHDIIQDAPISHISLIVCRNTLMYFNADMQSQVLARFHFAVKNTGYLFLGRAEMLFSHSNLFAPVDLRRRVFSKVPSTDGKQYLRTPPESVSNGAGTTSHGENSHIREFLADMCPLAQIAVDTDGHLVVINDRARTLFSLTNRDLGRPLQDLEISYRPAELRSRMEQAIVNRQPVIVSSVEWPARNGDSNRYDIQIRPLLDKRGNLLGVGISFIDVTRYNRLQEELEESNRQLQTAYEEVQSTNEELETTNEELQSSTEELETTNEELQSTNEELETMNEELQSTNEEVQATNDELSQRSLELNQINDFMESILSSLHSCVVVIDPEMHIQVWNRKAEDLWGLRAEEVMTRNFLNLDIGFPLDSVSASIRACLSGKTKFEETFIVATNRRGREIHCRACCSPLVTSSGHIKGAIVIVDDITK